MDFSFILMRHGQIVQYDPSRYVGQSDIPLDEAGRAQAARVAGFLAKAGITRIVSSDLSRTMETARIVSKGWGVDIEPEPRLREIFLGQWEGLTRQEVMEAFPGQYQARGEDMANVRPDKGESFKDAQDRVWPVFERLAASEQKTLIVAHAGVNRTILCKALGMPLENLFRLGQEYCCLNFFSRKKGEIVLEGLNFQVGE